MLISFQHYLVLLGTVGTCFPWVGVKENEKRMKLDPWLKGMLHVRRLWLKRAVTGMLCELSALVAVNTMMKVL